MSMTQLEVVDQDGAIREALENVSGDTRADFLRKAALTGGGVVGGGAVLGALARPAAAATVNDVNILNFALTLEHLEASFYTEAENKGALKGRLARFAEVVGAHERAHVAALQEALGSAAIKKPKFDFQGTTTDEALFGQTAVALEDTGVAAYAGAAPSIDSAAVLEAALGIHSVEARHAAWIRHVLGSEPSPEAFDQPKTVSEVLAIVTETKFIASPLMTASGEAPAFTG